MIPVIDRRAPGRDPVNAAVSRALGVGSLLAASVLSLGTLVWLVTGAAPSTPTGPGGWLERLAELDPTGVIFIGLALVTLTPVAQLVVAVIAFARAGEWRHVVVAGGVLAIVVASAAVALLVSGGG